MRALRDLPNREGFRFIGVYDDGSRHECTVRKNHAGCHSVYRDSDNEPCFMQLVGWIEFPVAVATDKSQKMDSGNG